MNVPQQLNREELDKFMPHKGKMYLLSRVNSYDADNSSIETEVDINSECIFFDEELHGVPNFVGFEYMAQTISALTGIKNALKDRPSLPGMILSVSDLLSSVDVFKNESTVKINVCEDFFDEETKIFRYACRIYDESGELLSGKITVMEVENFETVLK